MRKIFFITSLFLLLLTQCRDSQQDSSTDGSHQHQGDHAIRSLQQVEKQQLEPVKSSVANADQPQRSRGIDRQRSQAHAKRKTVEPPDTPYRPDYNLRNQQISRLRQQGAFIDLNEPQNRQYMEKHPGDTLFESMIMLSNESQLTINFDNDILDYTDRFYTNGIKIELISPSLRFNPLRKLMMPYWSRATNYYGLTLVQNMYTPSTTKQGGILYGDRPYSSYLYLGSFKISNDPIHRFRQTSELDIGIIGPDSYGQWVQTAFHSSVPSNHEPLGWEYQVQNDLVLNYRLTYEKVIYSNRFFEARLEATIQAGTLYCNTSGGIAIRSGWMNPYFSNLGISRKKVLVAHGLRKSQFFVFLKGASKLVGYDATLQGGMFNHTSLYTIPSGDISRFVFQSSGGLSFSHNGFQASLEQYLLSPEFSNGLWHKWVHISVVFCL